MKKERILRGRNDCRAGQLEKGRDAATRLSY